jgi:hypothetical protein
VKKILIILNLVASSLFGQSFDGVYIGELVSSKNVFTISTAGNLAIGAIHLNANDKLTFLGSWNELALEGKINLLNDEVLLVNARLSGDTLYVALNSPNNPDLVKQKGILTKISSDPKYDLKKVFHRPRPGYDERLIGKWVLVKTIDDKAMEVKSQRHSMEFRSDGWLYVYSSSLNDLTFPTGMTKIDPRTKWETDGSTIISRFESRMFGPVEFILTYQVGLDTLTTINSKNHKFIYKRK